MTTPEAGRRAAEAMCICTNVSGHMAGCPAGNSMQVNRVSLAIQDAIAQAVQEAERALADPIVKAALEIARRWREDGTENAIADIIAERDTLRLEVVDWKNTHGKVAHDLDIMRGKRDQAEQRGRALEDAIRPIYFGAIWSPDRPVLNANELWANLRDVAGFEPGASTKILTPPLTENGHDDAAADTEYFARKTPPEGSA